MTAGVGGKLVALLSADVVGYCRLMAEDEAASGIYRLFGSWDLVGRGTPNVGKVVFKVEHRHSIVSQSQCKPLTVYRQ